MQPLISFDAMPCLEYTEMRETSCSVSVYYGNWELGIGNSYYPTVYSNPSLYSYMVHVRSHRFNPDKIQEKSQKRYIHLRFLIGAVSRSCWHLCGV